MHRFGLAAATWAVLVLSVTGLARGAVVFEQGFEIDTTGWAPLGGAITPVLSGTDGIASAAGARHVLVSNSAASASTRFDGDRCAWPGSWAADLDVYLDTNWALGSGFVYSVATNGTDGEFQREFIFHVTKDSSTHKLLVGVTDTNTGDGKLSVHEGLEDIDHYEVTAAGWYTLQHVFYESDGTLAVDLNLLDSNGGILFTETRTNASDAIPDVVGGNRYGFLTFVQVGGAGLAIDNSRLEILSSAPEPATLLIWCLLGLAGIVWGYRR